MDTINQDYAWSTRIIKFQPELQRITKWMLNSIKAWWMSLLQELVWACDGQIEGGVT